MRAFLNAWAIIFLSIFFSTLGILTWPISPRGDLYLRYANWWARAIFWVCGIRMRTVGGQAIDRSKPYLYMSNHQSLTDILALFAALPQGVVMLSKRSVGKMPIFGWGMWLNGFVFIDRSNRDKAMERLKAAGRRIRRGRSVLIFPEGTRALDGKIQPFKRGGFVLAAEAQVPIVAVGISGTIDVLPRDHFNVYPGEIAVSIGDPMEIDGLDQEAIKERVRTAMLKEMSRADSLRDQIR